MLLVVSFQSRRLVTSSLVLKDTVKGALAGISLGCEDEVDRASAMCCGKLVAAVFVLLHLCGGCCGFGGLLGVSTGYVFWFWTSGEWRKKVNW